MTIAYQSLRPNVRRLVDGFIEDGFRRTYDTSDGGGFVHHLQADPQLGEDTPFLASIEMPFGSEKQPNPKPTIRVWFYVDTELTMGAMALANELTQITGEPVHISSPNLLKRYPKICIEGSEQQEVMKQIGDIATAMMSRGYVLSRVGKRLDDVDFKSLEYRIGEALERAGVFDLD
jgi:hypothetical protein